ncbi:unnamed protein product, partial [Amoebophrya sp. A25]
LDSTLLLCAIRIMSAAALSVPRSNAGYSRRAQQGIGLRWFLDVVQERVPDIEFFCLPRNSQFPVVMRRRCGSAADADDRASQAGLRSGHALLGDWVPLQVRTTVRTKCNIRGKPGRLCDVKNPGARRCPEMPVILASQATNSLYMLGMEHRPRFAVKKFSEHRLDLHDDTSATEDLPSRFAQLIASEQALRLAAPLLPQILTASHTSVSLLRSRELLVRAMCLPVLNELTFPTEALVGLPFNAKLRGRRVLFRSFNGFARHGRGVHLSLYKYDHCDKVAYHADTDSIDLFLFFGGDPDDHERLSYIAVLPKHVLFEHGFLSGHGQIGKKQPYLTSNRFQRQKFVTTDRTRMDKNEDSTVGGSAALTFSTGSSFEGLSSYFFEINRKDLQPVDPTSRFGRRFTDFCERILEKCPSSSPVEISARESIPSFQTKEENQNNLFMELEQPAAS